ncbi:hypothetical protein AN944_04184 [Shewanella sp. P1-14-1]|uniref:hypothetical protein n=1 Tax=Shewanella sp. P1-14-1 TaxID=1723761 RepID=UPI0006D6675F|nr:hypothetical protein [Shewanella sp. P1-14-1]KPZ67140.1 hypothetical protein AN944_04184 [Shewanella sp. P1-14-1]
MDKSEFVGLIKQVVSETAVDGIVDNLQKPPGRRPHAEMVKRSAWFNSLSETDKDMLRSIVTEAVDESVFGFLCVLDGVRAISEQGENNDLHLTHRSTKLNDDKGEMLHDLYNNI